MRGNSSKHFVAPKNGSCPLPQRRRFFVARLGWQSQPDEIGGVEFGLVLVSSTSEGQQIPGIGALANRWRAMLVWIPSKRPASDEN